MQRAAIKHQHINYKHYFQIGCISEKRKLFCSSKWTTVELLRTDKTPDFPEHRTLALMIVGLGSKMPCIFLKAGMTKRLQVTTADTGFPRTDGGRTERMESAKKNIWVTSLTKRRLNLSFSQLHTLPGRAKMSLRAPSMSKVANVVGRLKKKGKDKTFTVNFWDVNLKTAFNH